MDGRISHSSMMLAIAQVPLSYLLCLHRQGKGEWFWHNLRVKDTRHLHSVVNQEKIESQGMLWLWNISHSFP